MVPRMRKIRKTNSVETTEVKRGKPSRGQGGGRGKGKPPPRLGGLGASEDRKKEDRREEKFGGLEERRALYMQTRWVGEFDVLSNQRKV